MALSKLEGRITFAAAVNMTVTDAGGTHSVVVAGAGDYYLTTDVSPSIALLTQIGNALTADSTLSGTYTLAIDDNGITSTGKVTITGSGTFSVAWDSTTLRDVLGFTGSLASASSYLSPSASPYVWLPDQRRANPRVPEGQIGAPVSDATATISPTGKSKIIKNATRYVDSMEFRYLSGTKTWRCNEVTPNESLQSFWETVISAGQPLRYHTDRSDDVNYVAWRNLAAHDMLVKPEFEGFVGSAAVNASRWKYGPADVIQYR